MDAAVFGDWSRVLLATFLILEIGMYRADNADALFIHRPPSSGRTVGTCDRRQAAATDICSIRAAQESPAIVQRVH